MKINHSDLKILIIAKHVEDMLLYHAMMEGDSEIIPIEEVEQMLKDKINERNIRRCESHL
jgi:hypothetical protein